MAASQSLLLPLAASPSSLLPPNQRLPRVNFSAVRLRPKTSHGWPSPSLLRERSQSGSNSTQKLNSSLNVRSALVTDGSQALVPEVSDGSGGIEILEVAEGVWTFTQSLGLRSLGLDPLLRMTAIKLPGGGVWLHDPVNLTDQVNLKLAELGPIAHVVVGSSAPEHGVFARQYMKRYPAAKLYTSLPLKELSLAVRWGLKEAEVLRNEAPPQAWGGAIEQVVLDLREVQAALPVEGLFFHRASGVLLCSDALFYGDDSMVKFPFNRWTMRLAGLYEQVGGLLPLALRAGKRREVPRLRRAVRVAEGWPFRTLVAGHMVAPVQGAKGLLQAMVRRELGGE